MEEHDFEGTLVLEKIAEIGALDDFWVAIDADDVGTVLRIMKRSGIDAATMAIVVQKMENADGEH